LIAEYGNDTLSVATAAVSPDGQTIALQEFAGKGPLLSVSVLDGDLQPLGSPIVTQCRSLGLQFVDGFLFVGVQLRPMDASTASKSADDVVVFDLAN
jgi:hypothetical protein